MSRVRIVGGVHRSRLIDVPDAMGLRPTPDRVRETLFNWLGQDLEGLRCLDPFAGSGALGFEAASRGASEVIMVELAPKVFTHLQKTQAVLGANNVRLIKGDGLKFIANAAQQFDLVMLDPPFRQGWLEKLADVIPQVLAPGAYLYVESEESLAAYAGLRAVKSGKAGQVRYHLFLNDPTAESI